jgi:hypothetical protein
VIRKVNYRLSRACERQTQHCDLFGFHRQTSIR